MLDGVQTWVGEDVQAERRLVGGRGDEAHARAGSVRVELEPDAGRAVGDGLL